MCIIIIIIICSKMVLGLGNIIAGAFGGQGGCSEIGLTMLNLNSGGTNRTSGFSAAIFTLIIMYAAAEGINRVPIGGLVGIMFVVVTHCFDFNRLVAVHTDMQKRKRGACLYALF
jgi:MFS superfamily sulfate permease-like transporter